MPQAAGHALCGTATEAKAKQTTNAAMFSGWSIYHNTGTRISHPEGVNGCAICDFVPVTLLMFGQLLWYTSAVANDDTVCTSFSGNCTACRLAHESGAKWGSPCPYLSSPALPRVTGVCLQVVGTIHESVQGGLTYKLHSASHLYRDRKKKKKIKSLNT